MTTDDDQSSFEDSQDILDLFLSYHLDGILDLLYDLQDRYPYMFGSLRSIFLTDLILVSCDLVSIVDSSLRINCHYSHQLGSYAREYNQELNSSYSLICRYLMEFQDCGNVRVRPRLSFDTWCKFSFVYSFH